MRSNKSGLASDMVNSAPRLGSNAKAETSLLLFKYCLTKRASLGWCPSNCKALSSLSKVKYPSLFMALNTPTRVTCCCTVSPVGVSTSRSEEHTSELQSRPHLVCRLLLEKKKKKKKK